MELHFAPPKRKSGLWLALGAALVALVRKSGHSLHHSPLPEIREAARDWLHHSRT